MRRKNIFCAAVLLAAAAIISAAVPRAYAGLTKEQAEHTWKLVAQATELTKLPFTVKEDKVPNAWVKNGSSVTVTTALLNMLHSEAELYGVFAHEAGHAKLGHYERTVKRSTGLGIAAALLGQVLGDNAGLAVNLGANLANAGYSREQEIEADDYSVKLSHEHGEDITGLYRALVILSKYNKTEPSGFNSHPPDERRLLHIKNTILGLDSGAVIPTDNEVMSEGKKVKSGDNNAAPRQININRKTGAY